MGTWNIVNKGIEDERGMHLVPATKEKEPSTMCSLSLNKHQKKKIDWTCELYDEMPLNQ